MWLIYGCDLYIKFYGNLLRTEQTTFLTYPCNDSILEACDLADGACLSTDLCMRNKTAQTNNILLSNLQIKEQSAGLSRIFLRRGCAYFLQNTGCIRKLPGHLEEGWGCTPCTLLLDPPLSAIPLLPNKSTNKMKEPTTRKHALIFFRLLY